MNNRCWPSTSSLFCWSSPEPPLSGRFAPEVGLSNSLDTTILANWSAPPRPSAGDGQRSGTVAGLTFATPCARELNLARGLRGGLARAATRTATQHRSSDASALWASLCGRSLRSTAEPRIQHQLRFFDQTPTYCTKQPLGITPFHSEDSIGTRHDLRSRSGVDDVCRRVGTSESDNTAIFLFAMPFPIVIAGAALIGFVGNAARLRSFATVDSGKSAG